MGASQRRKGAAAEREVVQLLRAQFPRAQRNLEQSRSGGRDLDYTEPFCIEVKRRQALNIRTAYEQCAAAAAADETPVVVHRSDRTPWLVTLTLDDWLKLLDSRG